MNGLPLVLMTDEALRQRRSELWALRLRVDRELERIDARVNARAPKVAALNAPHGSASRYRAGCRCDACQAYKTAETARYRARKKSRTTTTKEHADA